MVLKAQLQKTLSAPECREPGTVSHSDGARGSRGSPKARSFVRPRRGAGQGCALRPGAAPDRGPLRRAAPQRQASPRRCPRRLPSPFPDPGNFPRPRLTSQQHAEAAGQEAPQHGPHLPPHRARSRPSPATGGQGTRGRGAGAAAAAAGLHAHAFRGREKKEKGARQGSSAPLRPGLARRQRLPPCRRLLPRRLTSPARRLIQPLPLAAAQGSAAGPPPSPCAPDPPPQRAAAGPREPRPPRALTPRRAPARWASRVPAG